MWVAVWATDMCAYEFPETWQCLHIPYTKYERIYFVIDDGRVKEHPADKYMIRRRCASTPKRNSSAAKIAQNKIERFMDFIVQG